MKIFSQDHTYKHSWGNVTLAFWRKYPNKLADHVKEVDTVQRYMDEQTGEFVTHRIIGCESALPTWLMSLGISPRAYVAEHTVVNPKTKTMVVRSRNISGSSMMVVEEKCIYTQHPKNPEWTNYRQEARITAFMPFVYSKLENYTHANMSLKSNHGLMAIEEICQNIVKHGLRSSFATLGL